MPQPTVPSTDRIPTWLIVLGSMAIAVHLGTVVVRVLAAPSGPWPAGEGVNTFTPPQFAADLDQYLRPNYLRFIKMTHDYHFPSNRPGLPSLFLEVRLHDEDGQLLKSIKIPEDNANSWVRHRQVILTQPFGEDQLIPPTQGEAVPAPGQQVRMVKILENVDGRVLKIKDVPEHLVPRDRPVYSPSEWSLLLARSYARYLCRTHGAAKAEIIRHHKDPIPPSVLSPDPPPAGAFEELLTHFGEYPR